MSAGYSQMALISSEIELLFESAVLEWVKNMVGFTGGSVVKDPPANAGDAGSIPASEDLEKKMATHPRILAWEIPWTEKPGRLQSMGSLRVRHD